MPPAKRERQMNRRVSLFKEAFMVGQKARHLCGTLQEKWPRVWEQGMVEQATLKRQNIFDAPELGTGIFFNDNDLSALLLWDITTGWIY